MAKKVGNIIFDNLINKEYIFTATTAKMAATATHIILLQKHFGIRGIYA